MKKRIISPLGITYTQDDNLPTYSSEKTNSLSMKNLLKTYIKIMEYQENNPIEYYIYIISQSLSDSNFWQKEMGKRNYILSGNVWKHPYNSAYNFTIWPDENFPKTKDGKDSNIIKYKQPKDYIDSIMNKRILGW
jgi:hypothetical protein